MQCQPFSEILRSKGIDLPELSGPFGAYVPALVRDGVVYVSGQLPMKDGKLMASGPVPSHCSVDDAKAAARQCVINALAAVRACCGQAVFDALGGVVRVGAFVQSDAGFAQQPQVANGASEFLQEVFGKDEGRHVRAAVGVNALPLDASVEVEFVFWCCSAAKPQAAGDVREP